MAGKLRVREGEGGEDGEGMGQVVQGLVGKGRTWGFTLREVGGSGQRRARASQALDSGSCRIHTATQRRCLPWPCFPDEVWRV